MNSVHRILLVAVLLMGLNLAKAQTKAMPLPAPSAQSNQLILPNTEPVKIRGRVVFDYQRPALAAFVRGLVDDPRHVGLDRLLIRTLPDGVAEIEVFALYRPPGGAPR